MRSDVAICSIIEPCLGIVAGCLPAMWSLRGTMKQWWFGDEPPQTHSARGLVLGGNVWISRSNVG